MTDQQVADNIKARQDADVLHTPGEQADPKNPPVHADEILQKALDPQLETALLVLKTRLVTAHLNTAQAQRDVPQPATP